MKEIGNNLKRYRLLNNMSLKEVGEKLNISAPAVAKYEKGDISINSQKLIEFANVFNIKSGDLLKVYSLPNMEFKSFRKKKKLIGQNLELLKNEIKNEVAKYLEVFDLNNSIHPNKIKKYKCDSYEIVETYAEKFRKEFIGISDELPVYDLTNVLENLGIMIVYLKNYNNKFDGFDGLSEYVNTVPFIILLKENIDGARQRFTLAHELAHLLLDIDSNLDEEKICHKFASALLMPKKAMIEEFGNKRNSISPYELWAIKESYKVSPQAIIYRLKDLKIISEYTYRNLCIYISKTFSKIDENPIKPEISYKFDKTVCKLETAEIISVHKAADLLEVTVDEYNKKFNNNRH